MGPDVKGLRPKRNYAVRPSEIIFPDPDLTMPPTRDGERQRLAEIGYEEDNSNIIF